MLLFCVCSYLSKTIRIMSTPAACIDFCHIRLTWALWDNAKNHSLDYLAYPVKLTSCYVRTQVEFMWAKQWRSQGILSAVNHLYPLYD